MFRKVQINLPLLDAIQQVPRYAKFLKELCTNKRKTKERAMVSQNVSALLKSNNPKKCNGPGMFSLPCVIGNRLISHAMLDLGASINVMPYNVFKDLELNNLQKTSVCIQLADRSFISPLGIVEDVLVKIDKLIFPADFYILEMNEACLKPSHSILLGRPFLKTAKAIINVDKGSLSVEFDGDIVTFNIFESMRYPDECLSLCSIELHDGVDELSIHDEFFEQEMDENRELLEPNVDYALEKNNCVNLFFSPQKLGIELKTLPPHLKYIFLGKKNTFPVIISRELNQKQEERLIEVLKKKKQAIG